MFTSKCGFLLLGSHFLTPPFLGEDLGAEDTGDNGVHASASPFEALAERSNWLRASISKDAFGKALLASGIPLPLLTKEW